MLLLDKILRRKDVCDLIESIINHPCYNKKKVQASVNYECFTDVEQPFFLFLDALYKYQIVIGDDLYLDDYIEQLDKLIKKIDNFHDIQFGIYKILGKTCALKLGIFDREKTENKQRILRYIYETYVVEGYLFHGFSGAYRSEIDRDGFFPEHYSNLYAKFIEVDRIFEKHGISQIMNKTFHENGVSFTDSFLMGCYYAVNSPMYFYHLLCDNECMRSSGYSRDAYFRNDYYGCFNNLTKMMKKLKFSDTERRIVTKTCFDEWKLLRKNTTHIHLLAIKREVLGLNSLKDINEIIASCDSVNLGEAIEKVMASRESQVLVSQKLERDSFFLIQIPNYKVLFQRALQSQKEYDYPTLKFEKENLANSYGKVSLLFLLGSLLITLGVILTIIMTSGGI